mmetsp:Transcript_6210/g.18727  ORF Transcript_6210/g.18727 Transcript_6210/m.18727 type:complete len:191 (+) Transcript_6210:182-754(+)|eukprot:CAMPEP_0198724768 /NCGR_PEP_ID=MMETSP1475-20131203/2190_1 /TAXON_ID= ORGANISM="Unidentified sp., Strain CCMP1999" /NCGR_SAMPLE_ID=MMETSP1475 /ASSEMBLY_ACC=CAM_ASM_001111 /LENGTH=190 /DNA_ID=CAMNT_0044486381 /DNA_START=121 /DNA_END=693 /DNA_ORIENTATION=+
MPGFVVSGSCASVKRRRHVCEMSCDGGSSWRSRCQAVVAACSVSLALLGAPSEVAAGLHEAPARFAFVDSAVMDTKFPVVWEGLRSMTSNHGTVLLFHNGSEKAIDINWINFGGREVIYAVVAPGSSLLQPTFASHPWSIRDHESQRALALAVADKGAAVMDIGTDGVGTLVPQQSANNPLLSFVVENFR